VFRRERERGFGMSGEHRLSACSFWQPAEKLIERSITKEYWHAAVRGKLSRTTGWQPVLPRITLARWLPLASV